MLLKARLFVVAEMLKHRNSNIEQQAASSGSHNIYENCYYTNDFLQISGAEKREPIAFFSDSDTKLHETLCRYVYKKKGMKKPETQEIKDEIERLVVKKLLKLGKIKE